MNPGELSANKLRDYRTSYIEVLNLKLALKDEILEQWICKLPGTKMQIIAKIQDVFQGFDAVRQFVTPYPGGMADTSWQVELPDHVLSVIEMIEDMVYSTTWDPRFRDAARSKDKIADFLQYESVRARMEDVWQQAVAAAKQAADASSAADPAAADSTDAALTAGGGEDLPSDKKPTSGFKSLSEPDQGHWDKYMDKLIKTYVNFVVIGKNPTVAELENGIRACPLATIRGDPTGLVMIYYDVKGAGESETRPELRMPPLREPLYVKFVKAALAARAPPGGPAHLRAGEVAIVLDGGRRGNASKLLAPWKLHTAANKKAKDADGDDEEDANDDEGDDADDAKVGFSPNLLTVVYTEESMQAKKLKVRGGTGSLRQTEWAHMLSESRIALPERRRLHYAGSTLGDTLVGVAQPDLTQEWQVTWKAKKSMLGKVGMIPVGGKTKGKEEVGVVLRPTPKICWASRRRWPPAASSRLAPANFWLFANAIEGRDCRAAG